MAILSKQIEQGIDPFCQFQIALRCCHGYQPKKVDWLPAKNQLDWQCLVAFNLTIGGSKRMVSKTVLFQNGAGGFPFGIVENGPIHVFWLCGKCANHRIVSIYSCFGSAQ